MNIIKNKRFFAAALTFVMFMAFVQPPLLTAKERRGSMVEVTMINGSVIKGELLAVKDDVLLLYDQNGRQGKSLDLQQVVQVKILKKSKALLGMVLGLLAGIPISISVARKQKSQHFMRTIVTMPPIFVLFGGIFGTFFGMDIKYSFAGSSPQISQQNLDWLKHYAREQDFEEPAAE